jgi:hypothetical protein
MHDSREDVESVEGEISDAQRERFEAARIAKPSWKAMAI